MAVEVLRSSQGWSLKDAADSISHSSSLELEGPAQEQLNERLLRILDVRPVWFAARAYDMGTAHPRSLQHARIITDIRPLFADDVTEPPPSAIISQTLILRTYDEDGSLKSVYVSLDDEDLALLNEQVERAQKKATTLRGYLERLGTPTHNLEKS